MKRNKNNHAARQSKKANGERKKKGREQAASQFHNGSDQVRQREKKKQAKSYSRAFFDSRPVAARPMFSEEMMASMFATPQEKLRDIREKLAEQKRARESGESLKDEFYDERGYQ